MIKNLPPPTADDIANLQPGQLFKWCQQMVDSTCTLWANYRVPLYSQEQLHTQDVIGLTLLGIIGAIVLFGIGVSMWERFAQSNQ